MCKSFNEASVMTHNSSKGQDVSVGLRRREHATMEATFFLEGLTPSLLT